MENQEHHLIIHCLQIIYMDTQQMYSDSCKLLYVIMYNWQMQRNKLTRSNF